MAKKPQPAPRSPAHGTPGRNPRGWICDGSVTCQEGLARKPLVIDLTHRADGVAELAKLGAAVSECLWHGHPSLKVIHGHGSGGGASRIKPQVLASLRKHAERLGCRIRLVRRTPKD